MIKQIKQIYQMLYYTAWFLKGFQVSVLMLKW